MDIQTRLSALKKQLPANVTLVAVSKTKPASVIMEAYMAGQRIFGENKVQEMAAKSQELPADIEWHMIGHLQRNKVRTIAPFVSLIHSVDSVELLKEIDKQGRRFERVIPCLLQLRIAKEETKFGMKSAEIKALLHSEAFSSMTHVRVSGLMGMATFTEDAAQIAAEFGSMQSLMRELSTADLPQNCRMEICSMGMSNDWEIAVAQGSTMVRIGSALFGSR